MTLLSRRALGACRLLMRMDRPGLKLFVIKIFGRLRLPILPGRFVVATDRPDALARLRRRDPKRVRLAVTRAGLFGDKLVMMRFIAGVRARFPDAEIFIFDSIDNRGYYQLFREVGLYDGVIFGPGGATVDLATIALNSRYVDLHFDNRYAVKVRARGLKTGVREFAEAALRAFKPFHLNFEQFPLHSNRLSEQFPTLSELEIMAASCGLDVRDMRVELPRSGLGPLALKNRPYVTIHHGAGRMNSPSGAHRQTKMWYAERWAEVALALRSMGVDCVQLGVDGEETIEGADQRFMAKTSLKETAEILRGARLHLDTEGGIVHLANVVGTKAVVLFGPTPESFFGYAENANLTAGNCHACWWSTKTWHERCPRGAVEPLCMNAISADQVVGVLKRLLGTADHGERACLPPPL